MALSKLRKVVRRDFVGYYFRVEIFTNLWAAQGIAANLLLMISKNSSPAGSSRHHYRITFCFWLMDSYISLSFFMAGKTAQMTNFYKYRTEDDTFQALSLILIRWPNAAQLAPSFLNTSSVPVCPCQPSFPSIQRSEARVRKQQT